MDLELHHRGKGPEVVSSTAKATSQTASSPEDGAHQGYSNDDIDLMRLGKKPVLRRNFGFASILGFSCTVLVTWEAVFGVSSQSFLNGGPAGLIWGYLIAWAGVLSTFIVLGELSSMAPTAGGQYHWVALLAPPSGRRFLSYLTGWMTLFGWLAFTASGGFPTAITLELIIVMCSPDYTPKPWQTMLFMWCILAFAVIINTVGSKTLATFEGLILILHILGFFAILIPLVYLAPHSDNSVWTTFVNEGAWPTQGLSFMVGLPSTVFALLGSDAAIHMSEEIKKATTVVPWSLVLALLLNGALGFAMVVAFVYCLGDLQEVLEASSFGPPFLHVFQTGTGSTAGAAVMGLTIVAMAFVGSVGSLASASRMLWSFSRDRGVPLWHIMIKLDPRTKIPVYTVAFATLVTVLLSLIVLGSSVAFTNIVNLTILGLCSSYLICCILLLWRRLQAGGVAPYDPSVTRVVPGNLHWGPYHVPGVFGILNNFFAIAFLSTIFFFAFWPPVSVVGAETMNFSIVTMGGTVLFAVLWYFVKGRKVYEGPIVEMELE
ncbi:putative GABA permease [Xylariomycetidae sp. FL0641]|nr:putative GABA permease [Xylariomycetidae sp. FL0641]